MKFLFVLTVLFAVAYCQQIKCKSTPPMWSGAFHESNYEPGPTQPNTRFGYVDYDGTGQRIRIRELDRYFEPGQDKTVGVEELYLFEQKEMYTYYPRESKCTTESLNDPFHPFAVPPTSEYSRREYLGASIPRLGVRVDSFHYGEDDQHHYHGYWAPLSATDEAVCIPVHDYYVNMQGPMPQRVNAHFTYFNITAVTSFPAGTFTKPAECQ